MSDPMYDVEKTNNQIFDYPESGELLQPVETATDDYIKVLCNSIINNINCLCEICANSDGCSVDKDDLISMLIDLNRNLEWTLNCNGEQPVDSVEYLLKRKLLGSCTIVISNDCARFFVDNQLFQ